MLAIINKTHAHGSDVRPVGRKQNCTLSEKRASNMYEIIKNVGNKKKNKRNKSEVYPGLRQNLKRSHFRQN